VDVCPWRAKFDYSIEIGRLFGQMLRAIETEGLPRILCLEGGVTMPYGSIEASEEVGVYASWALILVRMTYGSVGVDPRTVVQEKLHPAVAEPEFTPLNLSYMPVPDQH
jgi:hypothetical protein